jgi:hypothetical protein
MSAASLSGVALMGLTLVLHMSPFSPVARSPARLPCLSSLVHRKNVNMLILGFLDSRKASGVLSGIRLPGLTDLISDL